MNIVENIIKIRREKGISQEIIANALHVDTSVISNIENRKRELKVNELEIIAKTLAVDVLYLLTYPHIYVKREANNTLNQIDTILQIKLAGDKKDEILKLLFSNKDLEFLG
jgi:transcriptional regulator with XRE-family HTH domain